MPSSSLSDALQINERDLRFEISRFLFIASNKLGIANTTASICVVIFHRYVDFKGMDKLLSDDRVVLCSAVLFLGSKVDEDCRPLRDVINVVYRLFNNEISSLSNQTYHQLKALVVAQEQTVLRALGFNTQIDLPHQYMLNYARSLNLNQRTVNTAWRILSDTFLCKYCVSCRPTLVACACLYVSIHMADSAAMASKRSAGTEVLLEQDWWKLFDASHDDLKRTVGYIMELLLHYHSLAGTRRVGSRATEAESIDPVMKSRSVETSQGFISSVDETVVVVGYCTTVIELK